jgi:uncharacterized protein
MQTTKVSEDSFLLEREAEALLFSPLYGSIVKIGGKLSDTDLAQLISRVEQGGKTEPAKPKDSSIFPTSLALLPTADCQLRCVYCYSSGGKDKVTMDWSVAKAAIDLVAGNALAAGQKNARLVLVGGGEPTHPWELFTRSVSYFKESVQRRGMDDFIAVSTNCMLDDSKLAFIADNISAVQVSADGPEDIQNRQRPPNSHANVVKTIKFLEEQGVDYSVRVTATQRSVGRLEEIFDYFYSLGTPRVVHIEPAFAAYGRGCRAQEPVPEEFVSELLRVKKKSAETLRPFTHTGSQLGNARQYNCGAIGENFCVTPEGHVTSCYEVSMLEDHRSPLFFYGKFDRSSGLFVIDNEKRLGLRDVKEDTMSDCSDCYVQYNCGGGCMSKLTSHPEAAENQQYMCDINKELSFSVLSALAESGKRIETASGVECHVMSFPDVVNDPNLVMLLCHGCPPTNCPTCDYDCRCDYLTG